jgi:putative phosphoribosyl transferase
LKPAKFWVKSLIHDSNPIVLALPRGGVPVGFEVAKALHSDFDIFLVRKLGVPGHEELAIACADSRASCSEAMKRSRGCAA